MRATLDQLTVVVGGRLVGSADPIVSGLSTDSRALEPGQLFVPLVAERDGHEFIRDAIERGAPAHLTAREPVAEPAIRVADTLDALAALGLWARDRLEGPVVGVTGSVGKTTVKDLIASILGCRYRVAASLRSFNNEIGVPLTLFNAPDDTEAAVIEMGARGVGHIAELCAIARPTVGVVTTVGAAHLELFGTLEEVAFAKGELVEALPDSGTAVINADVPEVSAMATRTVASVVSFGMHAGQVRAADVSIDADLHPRFTLESPWGSVDVALEARGEHQVMNALAAAAAGLACGVSLDDVASGLAHAHLSPWRMALETTVTGAVVLNDAYNANPASTEAALRSLARLGAARRVAVLGPMAELGDIGPAAHRRVAALAAVLDIRVLAVGTDDYGPGAESVRDIPAAVERLGPLGPGDAVLVKGSRVAGLERLAAELVARPQEH